MRKRLTLLGIAGVLTLVLAACGSSYGDDDKTARGQGTSDEPASPDRQEEPAQLASVAVGQTSLGDVLVDAQGLTLYGFTKDTNGTSTCFDACADAWPAVAGDTPIGGGLDQALFASVDRGDGDSQLVAGKWPAYTYAGDGAPGEVNGQGVGGVWFALAPDGSLIK